MCTQNGLNETRQLLNNHVTYWKNKNPIVSVFHDCSFHALNSISLAVIGLEKIMVKPNYWRLNTININPLIK